MGEEQVGGEGRNVELTKVEVDFPSAFPSRPLNFLQAFLSTEMWRCSSSYLLLGFPCLFFFLKPASSCVPTSSAQVKEVSSHQLLPSAQPQLCTSTTTSFLVSHPPLYPSDRPGFHSISPKKSRHLLSESSKQSSSPSGLPSPHVVLVVFLAFKSTARLVCEFTSYFI